MMYHYALTSFTVYQSTAYSDNKTITEPYIDNDGEIRICPSCKHTFWVEDVIIETNNPYELVETLPKALDIVDLPFNMSGNFIKNNIIFYEKLLKQGFAYNQDKKVYLRIRLWWAINDLIRNRTPFFELFLRGMKIRIFWDAFKNEISQKQHFRKLQIVFVDNLKQLALLIDPVSDEDYLLLAEIYRELGQFKKAGRSIQKVKLTSNKPAKIIRRKINLRRKLVVKL